MKLQTIFSKPLPVVWYRFKQLVRLKMLQKVNFWNKIEAKVHAIVKNKSTFKEKSGLVISFASETIPNKQQQDQIALATKIENGTIAIFDVDYTFDKKMQWNVDWRSNHIWKNTYYKNYAFYEKNKAKEYDVKFPWELSRLSFLIPVARAYLYTNKQSSLQFIEQTLENWKANNPIANSVNWYPMEVSIRVVNLIQLRELLLLDKNTNHCVDILNEILLLHGIFLWRNVEYTDVRGNHYTANLTALLLLGKVFKKYFSEAKKWYNYALKHTEKEFNLQFIEDGVNFEKSIPYHRLVVELYLIAFIVFERSNITVHKNTLERLKKACEFTRDITMPNFNTPIIGDNDSASVFQNDDVCLNNHTNMLQLGSLFFKDESLNCSTKTYCSSFELFGVATALNALNTKHTDFELYHYQTGGYAIVKDTANYFITDVGEVGMKGRGGHGHNDLFSFELFLDNQSIIVDAGCYTYTGDLALKTTMKATAYHNGLTVDNQELAPMVGNWGISNVAQPYEVASEQLQHKVVITGKHSGYQRLEDPVTHQRTFEIEEDNFTLTCIDKIDCKSTHKITRNLHFSENVSVEIHANTVIAKCKENTYQIKVDKNTTIQVDTYTLSYNYGSKMRSKKVIFTTKIDGESMLQFSIEKV